MKKTITLRMDAEVIAQTKQLAERHNRSISNFIETRLKEIIAENQEVEMLDSEETDYA